MRSARRSYFGAIKKAKFSHWAEYLSSLSPSSLWEAKKLTCGRQQPCFPSFPDRDTPEGINSALINHFFPAPPPPTPADVNLSPFADYFPVSQDETADALAKSSSSAAPGPDTISYGMWKKVHKSCPSLLTGLIGPLLQYGHHPSSLKRANGAVLDKPGKASYDSPASFRVIVLLETLSKIVERVTASCLSLLARSCGLLHPHQTGSLPGLSSLTPPRLSPTRFACSSAWTSRSPPSSSTSRAALTTSTLPNLLLRYGPKGYIGTSLPG